MVPAYSTRHQTGDTDSFQLVIPLTVQLDSQGTFVPCEARVVGYSAGRTSSRQLRDTTHKSERDELRQAVHGMKYVILGRDTQGRPFYPVGKGIQGPRGRLYFYITAH